MSYDLYNPTTTITRTYSKQFWVKALELARIYGWNPMGTCHPCKGVDWLGAYLTNDGQRVIANDAHLLASALEKSLRDISDANPRPDWNPNSWIENDFPEWLSPDEIEILEEGLQDGLLDIVGLDPLEYFAGDEKRHLIKFIRFCRLGSFVIL
jgi:hypothetical protein